MCDHCPQGKWQDKKKYHLCHDCLKGRFSTKVGRSATCDHCPSGKFQVASGKNTCTHCAAGKFGNSKETQASSASHCSDCGFGKYQARTAQTTCTDCEVGRSQPTVGSTRCVNCAKGKYNAVTGQRTCVLCNSAKYQHEMEKTTCHNCPYGKWTAATRGNSRCNLIPTPSPTPVPTPVPTPAPTPVQICSHITCTYAKADSSASEKTVLIKHSSQERNGINHRCGVHKVSKKCTCTCFSNKFYSLMPGLGNSKNFGIATPAPTPRALVSTITAAWTLSYYTKKSFPAQGTAQKAVIRILARHTGIRASSISIRDVIETANAGTKLEGLGERGYKHPIYSVHKGIKFNVVVSHDFSAKKAENIRKHLNHLMVSPTAIFKFSKEFKAECKAYSAVVPVKSDFWLKSVSKVSTAANKQFYNCKAGTFAYKSALASNVYCLQCPVGTSSPAGSSKCFAIKK
jgi:hypothetical protein